MPNPLFSAYSQGENRVTATILAVLERLNFTLVEAILRGVLEEDLSLVLYRNQPSGPRSVPDGLIIVAARIALPDYEKYRAYICQPERYFRPARRLAFYYQGKIDRRIPYILMPPAEKVVLNEEGVEAEVVRNHPRRAGLLELVGRMREAGDSRIGGEHKVLFLSAPDDGATLTLRRRIHSSSSTKASTGGTPV